MSCIAAGIIHYYFTLALKTHSWNTIYQGLALCGLLILTLTLTFVRSPKGYIRNSNLSLKESLHLVFNNKQIVLCTAAGALSFGVLLTYASFWYMPVQTYYAVEKLQAVGISGLIFIGLGVGTPLWGWISNLTKSRTMVIHTTLVLGIMSLLLSLYLPHFNVNTLIFIKIIAFLTGFFLSGSMLFYTVVSEVSSNSTRGVAISVLNTAVFLFNTLMMFIPYLLITIFSKDFFTYLWILPFCILLSVLLIYFIKNPNFNGIKH